MDSSSRQMLEQANRLHHQGSFSEARKIYERVLAIDPQEVSALHYLGLLLHQMGDTVAGLSMLRRSVELAPAAVPYRYNLAMVLQEQRDFKAAVDEFSAVVELQPNHADAYARLALCLRSINQLPEAERAIRRAIELRPNDAQSHNNLGSILRELARDEEAIVAFRTAIQLDPKEGSSYSNLGSTYCALGRHAEAEQACRRGAELSPDNATVWLNFATALTKLRRLDEAVEAARRCLAIDPKNAYALLSLAGALNDQGLITEGTGYVRQAIALQPLFRSAWATYVYCLLFDPASDPVTIRREHERWNSVMAKRFTPAHPQFANGRDPNKRLRIGYVGPTFRTHVVGLYLEPILESHDHQNFEIACYSDVQQPDELTFQLKKHADLWRDTGKLNDLELARQIREDQVDILIDLNLHMAGGRLLAFALKPAPVQLCHLGYPATTGLSAMDYAMTDVHLDPPGEPDSHYVERLLRMPDSYWCYKPPRGCPQVNSLPAIETGRITFGSLNNFAKTNERVMEVWGRILNQVPRSRLAVMIEGGGAVNQTILKNFARHEINNDQLLIVERRDRARYMALYHHIDVALDPFPYAGHTTSFDAAWMGVPLITLPGANSVSRAGVTILHNLKLNEFIADGVDGYIRLAVQLANNLPRLAALRQSLRERMIASPLTDAVRYTRHFEARLREAWKNWCNATAG